MKIKSRRLFFSALMAALLSAGAQGEILTVTGNNSIVSDTTYEYVTVGDDTTAGNLVISGTVGTPITLTTTSAEQKATFRSFPAGIKINNGTVSVSNATLTLTGSGVQANAMPGNSATLILNSGAILNSGSYTAFGGDVRDNVAYNGKLIMYDGSSIETARTFYVGGDGAGYATIYGGTLHTENGLQVGRDHDKLGLCSGELNIRGGLVDVDSYFIMANLGKAGSLTKGLLDMSSGTLEVGSYFTMACVANVSTAVANIYGDSKINVGGVFNIGNGESSGSLQEAGGIGVFNLRDTASVAMTTDNFMGIGALGSLNLYGGTFTTISAAGVTNAGSVKIDGGTLVGNLTNAKSTAVVTGGNGEGKIVGNLYNNAGTLSLGSGETLHVTPSVNEGGTNVAGTGIVTVGDATNAASVNINGGSLVIEGSKMIENFRTTSSGKAYAGLLVQNGTVTVNGGNLETTVGGIFVGAKDGQSAVFTMNAGTVTSKNYPTLGAEVGTSGTMNLNGGVFTSQESFYVAGNGSGTLNMTGGDLYITGGMQLARNYDAVGGGCTGTINMSGGNMHIAKYFIAAYNADATENSTDVTSATLNMSGGQIDVTQFFTLAGNINSKNPALVVGKANLSGSAILNVTGNFNLGNGEGDAGLTTKNGYGTINLYDAANITAKANANIGLLSSLNLYGGEFNSTGTTSTFTNAGKVQISGGDLNVTGTMNNTGTLNFTAGMNGFGKLAVTGNLANTGTINVGLADGLAMVENYNASEGVAVATVSGTKPTDIVKGALIESAAFSGNDLIVKLTNPATSDSFDAACGGFTLDSGVSSGWVSMTNFSGSDPYVFKLSVNSDDLTGFVDQLNADLQQGDRQTIYASAVGDIVEITGITADALAANVFAWNFTDTAYANAALTALQSNQVPEPASWALLVLGAIGVFFTRRNGNIRKA